LQDGAYLFGLSPTNEAIQVALKMRSQGYSKALIIAPRDAWGEAITLAFKEEWSKGHGIVVDSLNYQASEDMTGSIRDFLQVDASLNRAKEMQHIVGPTLQTTTTRRQDFDAIFLLAYPSKARQIMPLLHYYYAGDVPVYATSSVYSGTADALKDKDLDGVQFCDIPFVFSHQKGSKNWPEQFNSYNRLYALGIDSYALTTKLNPLLLFPAFGSQETNGTLYLTPTQQVARIFEWGQFKQGLAHSMAEGRA
jgi:outer membrane PBP1 activator LpoA protein